MTKNFYNFITLFALVSLLHSAYSAAQNRAYLRLVGQPFTSVPGDILAQAIISLVVLIFGASFVASPFQHIKKDPNRDKSWDDVASCLSFATFGNRAYAMSPSHAARQQEPMKVSSQQRYSSSPDFSHLPGARLPRKATSPSKSSPVLEISSQQAKESFQHCLSLVKKHDVDSYLSILSMPKKTHPELFAIHALNVELALIRDKIDTSRANKDTTGMYRLQFWKDALSAIYGSSYLPIPRQPVAVALCSFASEADPKHLESLVISRQQSLGDRPFNSVFEVCGYGTRTTGALIQLQVNCLTRNATFDTEMYKEDVGKAASDIGGAFGVVNLVRSSLPLLARGVVLLPLDLLQMNDLTPDKVYNQKQKEDIQHVVRDMTRVSSKYLIAGREKCKHLPYPIKAAFAPSIILTGQIIKQIEKAQYDLFSPYLQRRNPLFLWKLLLQRFFI